MAQREIMNTRILVIDDEESIRDGFQMILGAAEPPNSAIDAAASLLFDDAPPPLRRRKPVLEFKLDLASNGQSGIERVREAVETGHPYALIFCDIRMPGIDGVETIEEIRKIDSRAEIVFITAYSDHSVETIVERAGANVSYFIKPFVTDEARQLATKLVLDWNKARELEELMLAVSSLRGDAQDIERLLRHLLSQTCAWLDTDSAALFRQLPDHSLHFCLGVGDLDTETSSQVIAKVPSSVDEPDAFALLENGTIVLRVKEFGLIVALPGRTKLTPDRRTVLITFLQHAALAIKNRETEVELDRTRRMAGIGQGVGYLLHDLRHPLGTTQMILKLLRNKPQVFASPDDAYDMMAQEVQRSLDLVSDVLSLCQSEIRIQPSMVRLRSALDRALRIWQLQLGTQGIVFVVEISEDVEARVDVGRLERALANLLKNASEAVVDEDVRRIELGARMVPSGAEIWVSDSGRGIANPLLNRLFEPFATAEKVEGVGFGLAIVKQVVDAHMGRVEVMRQDEKTRFVLFFPNSVPSTNSDKPLQAR